MLHVVEKLPNGDKASYVDLGQRRGVVIFEADTQDELHGTQVGHEAIQFANAGGLVGAAIRDEGSVYAVDAEGNMVNPLAGIPAGAKFRIEFKMGSTL